MQWFIDIMKELIHGQLGFFNRGDPAANDFTLNDFTRNGAWHALDLSAIVPADAQAVLLRLRLRATAVHKRLQLRRNGQVFTFNQSEHWSQVANVRYDGTPTVPLDSDRKIEYWFTDNTFNICDFTVMGWWLR